MKNEDIIPISRHKYIRWSFILGFIWGVGGLIYCTNEYKVSEDELIPAFFPAFALMIPTFFYFCLSGRSPELVPGFVGLYFRRRRLEEEAKIAEISGRADPRGSDPDGADNQITRP